MALNEPGTLDELGIGPIRDTIADTLFPGTSTIQTRARYFLFIPWILQKAEEGSLRVSTVRINVRVSGQHKCQLPNLPRCPMV